MRFNQTDMFYKENGKKNADKWMRKDLLINKYHFNYFHRRVSTELFKI